MVDVKWDFQGGGLSPQAAERGVGKVLTFYKEALDGVSCPIHQQAPALKVTGRTVPELSVSLEVCCDELLQKVNARVGGLSRRDQD